MNFKHKSEVKYDGILKIVQEMESKEKSSNLEEIKEEYDQRISNQLNELQMFILHPMEQLKLQNDKEIWDQVNLVTYQDFSSISLSNATLLVAFLEKAQGFYRNVPILHYIYYCMTKTNRDEKEEIFKLLGENLSLLKVQGLISPKEMDTLIGINALIEENSNQLSYPIWAKALLPLISDMSCHTSDSYRDILYDSSSHLLVRKIPIAADPQCFTLPREAEKYLSESALKKSMVLSCSHAKGLIEAEILIMVEMLNKGQITAYLSANVGKLIMK
ncbi:hypothetical protein PSTT_06763 [Puccinia striiformis]|uniref:Uncharacterized protein n=3 Tax=Puccinia striiformis TaxID=27350 RepID=A0A0L0V515_9BASI|nr:hypothetical protein PSTG_12316 [Puccinia striiformis f. sp. tritici PST-78]POW09578.1 hypothetical protein PSTT_06763 [Puccinia striiformis]